MAYCVTMVPSSSCLEREQIHQRLIANDDPRRVHRSIAGQVFQHERRVDQLAGRRPRSRKPA